MHWRHLCTAALVVAGSSLAGAAPLAPDEGASFNAWLRDVQARLIRSALKSRGYPRSARVVVGFSVERDGHVSDIRIISSSDPDPRFASLSARAVSRAGPFPPIPASYQRDHAAIVVPLNYHFSPPHRRRRR